VKIVVLKGEIGEICCFILISSFLKKGGEGAIFFNYIPVTGTEENQRMGWYFRFLYKIFVSCGSFGKSSLFE